MSPDPPAPPSRARLSPKHHGPASARGGAAPGVVEEAGAQPGVRVPGRARFGFVGRGGRGVRRQGKALPAPECAQLQRRAERARRALGHRGRFRLWGRGGGGSAVRSGVFVRAWEGLCARQTMAHGMTSICARRVSPGVGAAGVSVGATEEAGRGLSASALFPQPQRRCGCETCCLHLCSDNRLGAGRGGLAERHGQLRERAAVRVFQHRVRRVAERLRACTRRAARPRGLLAPRSPGAGPPLSGGRGQGGTEGQPPPFRTNWTSLVPPSVLTGHVS
jgi:hypothetical protein